MKLGLGIDTGGTYTDSVIIDLESGTVIKKAKALTTREDLSIGIGNSLRALEINDPQEIGLVSMSSTLATNSVVEGKGCRVALVLIGMGQREHMPVDHIVEIEGGHGLNGLEQKVLDIDAAKEFICDVRGKVDAFAISSLLSIRNPDHELRVRDLVMMNCDHPIVCGHELSSQLGFYERTITAVLNAKLIPIITELIIAVRKVLEEQGIKAPLMVVKGDGSLMGERMAVHRPVETVLSGPAASLVGAKFLTKEQDAVIIDVGGTTTDIGILRGGKPRLDPEGALIGGWRTRVMAVDVMTSGIGGDSRIIVTPAEIILSSQRVVPLCIASRKHPEIIGKLRAIRDRPQRQRTRFYNRDIIPQMVEFFIFSTEGKSHDLSPMDKAVINSVRKEPRTIFEIGELTGIDPYVFNVRHLEEIGIISRVGLTPTDILHAMGSFVEFDAEASALGVEVQSKVIKMTEQAFCESVRKATIDKIAREVLVKLIHEDSGLSPDNDLSRRFVDQIVSRRMGVDYTLKMELNKKIIGIGAPVGAYLPDVAIKFGSELLLPEHSEVGNAIGAITGSVLEKVEVLIRPKLGMSNTENPPCTVFATNSRKDFPTMAEAKEFAIETAKREASRLAMFAGADSVELVVEVQHDYGKVGNSYGGGGILLGVLVRAIAMGKPKMD